MDVAVQWWGSAKNEDNTTFLKGEIYQATITLKVKNGYLFDGGVKFKYQLSSIKIESGDNEPGDNDTVSRAASSNSLLTDENVRVLFVTYPPAKPAEGNANVVLDYNLQSYVPVPVTGGTPVKTIVGGQHPGVTGTVEWSGASFASDGTFVQNNVYKADITLTTTGVYIFDPEVSFSYANGVVSNQPLPNTSATTRKLTTVTYMAATAAGEIEADYYNLTDIIPAPVGGSSPVLYKTNAQYSVLVLWTPRHSVFVTGQNYTATVYLYAGPKRYFGAGKSFTHDDSTVVNPSTAESMFRSLYIPFGLAAEPPEPPDGPPTDPGGGGGGGGNGTGKIGIGIIWGGKH
jgi:hypothetical protein